MARHKSGFISERQTTTTKKKKLYRIRARQALSLDTFNYQREKIVRTFAFITNYPERVRKLNGIPIAKGRTTTRKERELEGLDSLYFLLRLYTLATSMRLSYIYDNEDRYIVYIKKERVWMFYLTFV